MYLGNHTYSKSIINYKTCHSDNDLCTPCIRRPPVEGVGAGGVGDSYTPGFIILQALSHQKFHSVNWTTSWAVCTVRWISTDYLHVSSFMTSPQMSEYT